jgi:hypothetical protein
VVVAILLLTIVIQGAFIIYRQYYVDALRAEIEYLSGRAAQPKGESDV